MKITSVDLFTAPMARSWLTEKRIANPMSIYPEYAAQRNSWYRRMSAGVVRITVEDGTAGLGFVGGGKAAAAAVVLDEQVRDLLLGQSCFNTELLSERLQRATVYYGRGGITQSLLSGIDIALWDLKGKLIGQPVCNLLGGRAQETLRPYLTSWSAESMARFGIRDVKIAMPHGPADGEAGMRENLRVVEQTRTIVGGEGWIALDCYMAWDVPYTIEMARRLKGLGVAWIEEPVLPEDVRGYRRIREAVDCMISGGEHTFTLEGFRALIEEGRVDIVQPDIYRAGGPTMLRKVAALARAHGCRLICHGIGLATYHFLISNGREVTPRCEFLDIYGDSRAPWLFEGEPAPQAGELRVPDLPGFGYRLNEAALQNEGGVAPIW